MWYFAGKKSEQTLLEFGGSSLDFNVTATRDSFLAALSTNHGVGTSDISFFVVADSSTEVSRILGGESWALAWSGAAPTGEISSISFASEDAKKWLRFSADKTEIDSDNNERVTISVTMLLANRTDTDTSFSGNLKIPIAAPNGGAKVKFVFSSGAASKALKFSQPGVLSIGTSKMADYRMDNSVYVDVVL